MGKAGPLERAQLANLIQGFRIPDRSDAWENNKYLLLIEFQVRTVSYGPSFPPKIYGPGASRLGHKSKGKKTRIRNLQYGPRIRG